jgi:hypothetical protein
MLDQQIAFMFNNGKTYTQIAEALHLTKGKVAGRCRMLGLVRNPERCGPRKPVISAAERAEREKDQRDLDILSDIQEGHSIRSTAKHWGVPYKYAHDLVSARRAA